jgi:hypothetical protein
MYALASMSSAAIAVELSSPATGSPKNASDTTR